MEKLFVKILVTIALITTATSATNVSSLVNEFKHYQTTNCYFHAGNLYEHSIWVATTINEWFENNSEWTQGLTNHDRKLATLAGLLHDVAKGGDHDFIFYTKPGHPRKGQQYILSEKNFLTYDNNIFNFKKMFDSTSISNNDKKIVSILVAAHHDFGTLLKNTKKIDLACNADDTKPYVDAFKQRLHEHALHAGYNKPITQRLIKLAILVAAADVKGAQCCPCHHPFTIGDLHISHSPAVVHQEATDKFKEFEYHTRGKKMRKIVIKSI